MHVFELSLFYKDVVVTVFFICNLKIFEKSIFIQASFHLFTKKTAQELNLII